MTAATVPSRGVIGAAIGAKHRKLTVKAPRPALDVRLEELAGYGIPLDEEAAAALRSVPLDIAVSYLEQLQLDVDRQDIPSPSRWLLNLMQPSMHGQADAAPAVDAEVMHLLTQVEAAGYALDDEAVQGVNGAEEHDAQQVLARLLSSTTVIRNPSAWVSKAFRTLRRERAETQHEGEKQADSLRGMLTQQNENVRTINKEAEELVLSADPEEASKVLAELTELMQTTTILNPSAWIKDALQARTQCKDSEPLEEPEAPTAAQKRATKAQADQRNQLTERKRAQARQSSWEEAPGKEQNSWWESRAAPSQPWSSSRRNLAKARSRHETALKEDAVEPKALTQLAAAAEVLEDDSLCWDWKNTGYCAWGDRCWYKHEKPMYAHGGDDPRQPLPQAALLESLPHDGHDANLEALDKEPGVDQQMVPAKQQLRDMLIRLKEEGVNVPFEVVTTLMTAHPVKALQALQDLDEARECTSLEDADVKEIILSFLKEGGSGSTVEEGDKDGGGQNEGTSQAAQKAEMCRYFAKGHCMRGAACWYSHDPPLLLQVVTEQASASSSQPLLKPTTHMARPSLPRPMQRKPTNSNPEAPEPLAPAIGQRLGPPKIRLAPSAIRPALQAKAVPSRSPSFLLSEEQVPHREVLEFSGSHEEPCSTQQWEEPMQPASHSAPHSAFQWEEANAFHAESFPPGPKPTQALLEAPRPKLAARPTSLAQASAKPPPAPWRAKKRASGVLDDLPQVMSQVNTSQQIDSSASADAVDIHVEDPADIGGMAPEEEEYYSQFRDEGVEGAEVEGMQEPAKLGSAAPLTIQATPRLAQPRAKSRPAAAMHNQLPVLEASRVDVADTEASLGQSPHGLVSRSVSAESMVSSQGSAAIAALSTPTGAGHCSVSAHPRTSAQGLKAPPVVPSVPSAAVSHPAVSSKAPCNCPVANAQQAELPPPPLPSAWRAKWSRRRLQHYFYRVFADASGTEFPSEHTPAGKPKTYWIEELSEVLTREGVDISGLTSYRRMIAAQAQEPGAPAVASMSSQTRPALTTVPLAVPVVSAPKTSNPQATQPAPTQQAPSRKRTASEAVVAPAPAPQRPRPGASDAAPHARKPALRTTSR